MEIILVSIGIVAKMFGVTTQTIRNWTKQGLLKEYRTVGGHRRYDLKEVKKLTGEIEEEKKPVIYSCHSKFREIRNNWVKKRYVSTYGLQARVWKLALKDSFETIDRYWASIVYKIRKEIFNSNLEENQKIYLLWAIKDMQRFNNILNNELPPYESLNLSQEKQEESIKYLQNLFEEIVKNKPRVKLNRSFIAEPETYRIFEKNGRQYIAITSLEKGKRIIIPLTGKTNIRGMIRVVFDFEKRRLEIHWVNNSKTKNTHKKEKIGIDLGITEVFTDSDSDRWGTDFGNYLNAYSDKIKDKSKYRNKLYALHKKYIKLGKTKKANNLLKHNLGKKKLKKKGKKRKLHLEQIVNKSLNDFFNIKSPKKIIYEDLTHLRGKAKSKKLSRLVSLWIRNSITKRLEFKASARCSCLRAVAAAYSSQICPNCDFLIKDNRKGDKFKCLFCNFTAHSDHAASVNLLNRDNIPEITLWTPRVEIKSIQLKRFKRRLENWDFSFKPSQVNWDSIKDFLDNFDEIKKKYSLV